MDLYAQIGVLLIFATLFSTVLLFTSQALELGQDVTERFNYTEVRYNADSSITSDTFSIGVNTFKQWVASTQTQRDVYLIYDSGITPTANMQQYTAMVITKQHSNLPGDRSVEVNTQTKGTSTFVPNAIKVEGTGSNINAYLSDFVNRAKNIQDPNRTSGKVPRIRVETYSDSQTGKTLYLCYVQ